MTRSFEIEYPKHLNLAGIPTPLQCMERLSNELKVDIRFKRDDMTGIELTGNKIRKLEFILSEAIEKEADTVLTCGRAQSNHCRATALAATRAGPRSLLILSTEDPNNPPDAKGNLLLSLMAGSEIVWITPDEYECRDEIFDREEKRLIDLGHTPYIISEGGSTEVGAWGYIRAVNELVSDLAEPDDGAVMPTTIISAVGSGGTMAGLMLGVELLELDIRVVGFNVCHDEAYFQEEIRCILEKFVERYDIGEGVLDDGKDIEIIDGYVGKGYAQSRPEELVAMNDLARMEGVILDPIYTGKAYYGMISELARDPEAFGSRIVFVHTGGLFDMLPIADSYSHTPAVCSTCFSLPNKKRE